MKKLTLTVLLLLAITMQALSQNAKTVDENTARQTALAFANANLNARGETLTLVSHDGIYIFNVGDHGFVIIAGNTVLPPVLGYSTNEPFPSLDNAPDNFTSWIGHYSEMIDFAMENGIQPEAKIQQQWDNAYRGLFPAKGTKSVEPLVTTQWNQDCYYNEYCPEAPGYGWWGGPCGHVYAGCVACAMAQVMKYWNYPETGTGSHSYVHSTYGEQSANFGATTYQWSEMPTEIYSHNDAVATLMYHCGVSVNMNYGPDGSSAMSKDVETALRSYFGYCGAKYREKSKYEEDVWVAMLKAELDQSHPMYYSGSSSDSGHAFVCDGYDTNDLFHFNFGWSGIGDDQYYSLYDVNSFNSQQAAVVNIVPMEIRSDENGIIYVSTDGQGNGSSWTNATSKLEYATYLCTGDNVRIWVKQGTYYGDETDPDNAFSVTASNKVYGGFNGDEGPDFDLNNRDLEAHPTILDGGNSKRVLNQPNFLNSGTRAVWDGFIIQNGNSGSGGGVYLNDYTTLSNCVIRNNVSNGVGGGVYINSATGTSQTKLDNCVITGNIASMGGGLCDRNSSTITNCVISNNTATTKGGGVYLYNSDKPVFRGCIISNNSAMMGGGVYARGKCTMTNCNIVMNKAIESYGGLFNEHAYLHSNYTSCIIWGNEAGSYPNLYHYNAKFEYCAVQGGIDGEGNINLPAENDGEEPGVYVRFSQPAEGAGTEYSEADWSIQSRSICLNAGKIGTPGYPFDIAGEPRVQHGRIDIGAYERNASLTLIQGALDSHGDYNFDGNILHQPGYYTAVYPMPDCDSVVGLTLTTPLGIEDYNDDPGQPTSIQVFDLTGRQVGNGVSHLAPGIYLIRYRIGDAVTTKKVVIE